MEKESFIFYEKWAEAIKQLPGNERLRLFDAIMAYGIYGEKTDLGGIAQMALNLIYGDIDNCKLRRKDKAEKAKASANIRWQKENANACERMRTPAINAINGDGNVNGDGDVNVNVNGDGDGGSITPQPPKKGARSKQPKFSAVDFIQNEPEQIRDILQTWIDYKRKQHRESYKTEMGIMAFTKKLSDLSGGDLETAKAIIEQSIANNWRGIFELKKSNQNGNNGANNGNVSIERIVAAGRAWANVINQ